MFSRFVAIRKSEAAAVGVSFAYFFFLLSGYYILRPIRDEMGIAAGKGKLDELFTWTFAAMLVVVPLYSAIVARFPRRRIIPIAYQVFAVCLLGFWGAWGSGIERALIAKIFFVWLSVYNLFVVSVFWSFMADLFREEQAKRLFGLIAAGGSAGAIAGPALTALTVERTGIGPLFLFSAILLEVCVACAMFLARLAPSAGAGELGRHADERIGGGPFAGFRLAMTSPYLRFLCAQVVIYSLLSTLLYFEQARIMREAIADPVQRTALFARLDLSVNLIAVALQALATGWVFSRLGLLFALLLIPAFSFVGFSALAASPTLVVLIAMGVPRRALHFAIERPATQVLYTVVGPEEKYKAKSFVDTVIYRGSDAASGWFHTGLETLKFGASGIALTAVPIAALGALVGWGLARRHAALVQKETT